jgi:hypothetical protein
MHRERQKIIKRNEVRNTERQAYEKTGRTDNVTNKLRKKDRHIEKTQDRKTNEHMNAASRVSP